MCKIILIWRKLLQIPIFDDRSTIPNISVVVNKIPIFDDWLKMKCMKTIYWKIIEIYFLVVNKRDFHFQVFSLKNQIDVTSSAIITRNFYLTFPVVTDRIILTVVTGLSLPLLISVIFQTVESAEQVSLYYILYGNSAVDAV